MPIKLFMTSCLVWLILHVITDQLEWNWDFRQNTRWWHTALKGSYVLSVLAIVFFLLLSVWTADI